MVASELKRIDSTIETVYIGQKGDPLADLPAKHPSIDESHLISAGKFRRYHGEGMKQLLDAPTMAKNARDLFRFTKGAGQAYRLLGKIKPNIIYTPGGYVGVPVGLAASRRKIDFVTHDLDALPGLANRINSRWAVLHITGQPADLYSYEAGKTYYAGVPVAENFVPINTKLQQQFRQELGIPNNAQVVLVIGGGLGAQRINDAVLMSAKALLQKYPNLYLLHGTGRANEQHCKAVYGQVLSPDEMARVRAEGFIDKVYVYSGAADLVVTRAGATNMAEFENQHKACIVIPSPVLSGGHQLKNIARWQSSKAITVLEEAEMADGKLVEVIGKLLDDPDKRHALGKTLGSFAKPHAARDVANKLVELMSSKDK